MDEAFCGRVGLDRKPLGPKNGWSGQQQCREPDCGAANHDSLAPTAITGIRACWAARRSANSMRCCASYRISFRFVNQSGRLGRVPNQCPVAMACLSKWGRGCGSSTHRSARSAPVARFINLHTFRSNMRGCGYCATRRCSVASGRQGPHGSAPGPADRYPSEIQMGMGETYDFDFVRPALATTASTSPTSEESGPVSMPIRVR